MNSLQFLAKLREIDVPLFSTGEISDFIGISEHSVGKYLKALKAQKLAEKVSRGKWVLLNEQFDSLQIPEFLTAPKETYISLHTALFFHGIIEQIPSRIYAVTIDRTKVVKTPFGVISLHHCHPSFFVGYEYKKPYLKMATMEKALVDYFYFSPGKSRQFKTLPEISLPRSFSIKRALKFCENIPSPRTRSLVNSKIQNLRSQSRK